MCNVHIYLRTYLRPKHHAPRLLFSHHPKTDFAKIANVLPLIKEPIQHKINQYEYTNTDHWASHIILNLSNPYGARLLDVSWDPRM